MDVPRNHDTTLADLKVGITAEKARRILGNPRDINRSAGGREQWCYPQGYVYIENGIVSSLQNRAGGVFEAIWR